LAAAGGLSAQPQEPHPRARDQITRMLTLAARQWDARHTAIGPGTEGTLAGWGAILFFIACVYFSLARICGFMLLYDCD